MRSFAELVGDVRFAMLSAGASSERTISGRLPIDHSDGHGFAESTTQAKDHRSHNADARVTPGAPMRIISAPVAPRARTASRWAWGTADITSAGKR